MNIGPVTKELLKLDPTLQIHNEGAWTESLDLTKDGGFTSPNDAGLECETGEFLYAMVRMLKPKFVLETGTHWGVGASYMGLALRDNGYGKLDTIEFLPENHARATQRINQIGLQDIVKCHFGDVAKWEPENEEGTVGEGDFEKGYSVKKRYGLILLDTEPQTRFAELIKFFDNLETGGFIFIHDLHRHMHQIPNEEHGFAWPYGPLPEEIKKMVQDGYLRPFHFTTPRGFTGFYKVDTKNDYKFNKK